MDNTKNSSFFFFGYKSFLFLLAVSDNKSLTPLPSTQSVKKQI